MSLGDVQAGPAADADQSQQFWVVVRGGSYPCLIQARAGRPLRLVFDRQGDGECTARVVFPGLGISASLPAFTRTAVELTPDQPGAFGFSCGMEMVWGILLVGTGEPAAAGPRPQAAAVSEAAAGSHSAGRQVRAWPPAR